MATPTSTAPPEIRLQVNFRGLSFSPERFTTYRGTRVTWLNTSDTWHGLAAVQGLWEPRGLAPGQSFSFTFNTGGVFGFYCYLHGFSGQALVQP